MDESQPIVAPVPVARGAVVVAGGGGTTASSVGNMIGGGKKRKRGRPPRGQSGKPPLPPKIQRVVVEEDEEEDVCFICFDGGSLVLCDRKGCPKAYHPACIKRDEEFFSSNAKWFCGWHICSVCQKASHYMCYTCTYSLCKGCTKNADYFCVRGKKGFCSMCMRTIMLIANQDQGNNEKAAEDATINDHYISAKSRVIVNAWVIGRNKNSWDDPESFKPSRFLKEGVADFKGGNFEFLPFGSGRRSCSGMQLGLYAFEMTLAHLLHCFNWELPDGMKPCDVDMTDVFGLTVPKATRLVAVPTPRLFCPLY